MAITNIYADDDAQSFETPKINHSVTAPRAQVLSEPGSLKYQYNNTTSRPGQKLLTPGK